MEQQGRVPVHRCSLFLLDRCYRVFLCWRWDMFLDCSALGRAPGPVFSMTFYIQVTPSLFIVLSESYWKRHWEIIFQAHFLSLKGWPLWWLFLTVNWISFGNTRGHISGSVYEDVFREVLLKKEDLHECRRHQPMDLGLGLNKRRK